MMKITVSCCLHAQTDEILNVRCRFTLEKNWKGPFAWLDLAEVWTPLRGLGLKLHRNYNSVIQSCMNL